jgi:hypothetical protein
VIRYQPNEMRPLPRRCASDSGAITGHFESSKPDQPARGAISNVETRRPVG